MNFPMEYPIFQFFFWLLNTSGLGGAALIILVTGSVLVYGSILWWVRAGSEADEDEIYPFPTAGLHQTHEE